MVKKYVAKKDEPVVVELKEEKPNSFDTVTKLVGSLNAKVQAKL